MKTRPQCTATVLLPNGWLAQCVKKEHPENTDHFLSQVRFQGSATRADEKTDAYSCGSKTCSGGSGPPEKKPDWTMQP